MDLNEILAEGVRNEASDILLKVGVQPAFRIRSDFVPLEAAKPLDSGDLERLVEQMVPENRRPQLKKELQLDLAYSHSELGRFRVNVFRQRGCWSVVIRVIPNRIRSFAELNLPAALEKMANARRGLILVTGTTGSGKSTTLATMVDHINRNRQAHIITIEDPIEYEHQDNLSYVNQREIGADAISFPVALRAAMRQNPDVILVGEMRDLETIETAIMAAETGHLVMSTLHTLDAQETITRAISVYPEHQRDQARLILATVLQGIASQRLLPRADGLGMVPAIEVLVASTRVREYIADKDKTRDLHDVIAEGHTSYGMQTFDQSLMALFRNNLITYDEALRACSNPNDFQLKVRGIASTSDSRWSNFGESAGEDAERQKIEIERF